MQKEGDYSFRYLGVRSAVEGKFIQRIVVGRGACMCLGT